MGIIRMKDTIDLLLDGHPRIAKKMWEIDSPPCLMATRQTIDYFRIKRHPQESKRAKVYNVEEVYIALSHKLTELCATSSPHTKYPGLSSYCSKIGYKYVTAAALMATMNRLSPTIARMVVVGRSGKQENFIETLAADLGVKVHYLDFNYPDSLTIPWSFARHIARLDVNDQKALISLWQARKIRLDDRTTETFVRSCLDNDFQFACYAVFGIMA